MSEREVIELVKNYIHLLNDEGFSVSKAFLFGSYSNNTATDSSDIDVMLVSEKYNERDDIAVGRTWQLTKKISTKIEPFLIGIQKFNNDSTSPLVSMVKAKGIKIL